jgi:anti-sigma factor RsiW
VNREFRRASTGEMLAYVDDCLSPGARAAFKDRMVENPEINNQIGLWLSQNEAIRAAFPVPPDSRISTAAGESAPRSLAAELAPPGSRIIWDGGDLDRRPRVVVRPDVRPPQPDAIPLAPARLAPARQVRPRRNALFVVRRMLSVLAGALAFWVAGVFFGNPSVEFARAATAAYRTFADSGTRPVEIATNDRDALNKWFAPQILRAQKVPDLAAAGLILLGGRIVPGAFSPAQYVLYENQQHQRFALEIEAIDAPPETKVEISQIGAVLCASWTGTGHSFELIGHVSRARLAELARLAREDEAGN